MSRNGSRSSRERHQRHLATTGSPHARQDGRRHPPAAHPRALLVIVAVLAVSLAGFCIYALASSSGAGDAGAAASASAARTASDSSAATEDSGKKDDDRAATFAADPKNTNWSFSSNGKKTIYLTFDDGPSENTQKVLDILDQYGVKATFFVTGLNPDYFGMIGVEYEKGHTVGMHTYTHDYAQVYASEDAYFNDLSQIAQVVEGQIGYVPAFVRFPGGSSNTICNDYCPGIMGVLTTDVPARGYQYYDWNASCGDGAVHTADEIAGYACDPSYLQYENIIMLMHDANGKESTVEALPRIIEYYQGQGYEFAAISRDTIVVHHR
jgi:peptidoglycan/xylan/chitin deacetylase (PgdA/CDA1 family)